MTIAVNPWVDAMEGYVPGEQLNDPDIIKLNTNEAFYPAAPEVAAAVLAETERAAFNKYPDPSCRALREAIAGRLGVTSDEIIFCNGSDEALRLIVHAYTRPGANDRIATCSPTYTLYKVLAAMFGVEIENHVEEGPEYSLPESFLESSAKIAFLPNPNPPIGTFYCQADLECLAAAEPNRLIVIDEAYVDFAPNDAVEIYKKYPNVAITRTFSKSFALAGLRAGFIVCHREMAASLNKIKDSYNVNRLTQAAALAAWNATDYYGKMIAEVKENRDFLTEKLVERGFQIPTTHGNFVFARRAGAKNLYEELKKHKILVRYFDAPGLNDGVRITIGNRTQMEKLLTAVDETTG